MYQIDMHDRVVELTDIPRMESGAPLPKLVTNEDGLDLIYLLDEPDPNWDGSTATMVSPDTERAKIACIRFDATWAHMLGPPNDEALAGHPLARRGLSHYAVFEILHSSWVRSLERMNAVHPNHSPEMFANLRHFIFTFHDETFECVARGYKFRIAKGSITSVAASLPSAWR
ncbi:hypothetical protein [Pelagibius sp. Alg239-R121]|uniref:hypothetical protein n=1 Tax=Pelagibius sp. Alg239-R121 TaxID=2993448 RepID=UPI0024A6A850|nr:hypothetical protein [Pelagibius sp. Alg239-R121]